MPPTHVVFMHGIRTPEHENELGRTFSYARAVAPRTNTGILFSKSTSFDNLRFFGSKADADEYYKNSLKDAMHEIDRTKLALYELEKRIDAMLQDLR